MVGYIDQIWNSQKSAHILSSGTCYFEIVLKKIDHVILEHYDGSSYIGKTYFYWDGPWLDSVLQIINGTQCKDFQELWRHGQTFGITGTSYGETTCHHCTPLI